METYRSVEIKLYAFQTSSRDGDGLSASRSGCFGRKARAFGSEEAAWVPVLVEAEWLQREDPCRYSGLEPLLSSP